MTTCVEVTGKVLCDLDRICAVLLFLLTSTHGLRQCTRWRDLVERPISLYGQDQHRNHAASAAQQQP